MIVWENIWVRQFTHKCVLTTQWAHEAEPTVRWERVRIVDGGFFGESGYRYEADGWAVMDTARNVYHRRLNTQDVRRLVRNRLPRERVRL